MVIRDRKIKVLRNKEVPLVLVQWQHQKGSEMTWELEREMREQHPELFAEETSRAKSSSSGGEL